MIQFAYIAACGAVARFTLIAMMLSSSSPNRCLRLGQQRSKLGNEVDLETFDHLFRNIGGKRVRQRSWGHGRMTATYFGVQVKNLEEFPTDGAAQFGNRNHIQLQGLGKYK